MTEDECAPGGRPVNGEPRCSLCGHPAGWHPSPGSPSDVARFGCLECSCDLNNEIDRLTSERDHWRTIALAQADVVRKQREGRR